MQAFLNTWQQASQTSLGLFWMAFWAFGLGYLISAMIQVFVTKKRMQQSMGKTGGKSMFLGTFFGFISSSCSFSALSTTRALFAKGAGFLPSMAFLLASTNLVIELGIVIAVFLSWQFVVGEYVGGILLILFLWIIVKLTLPKDLEEHARENAKQAQGSDSSDEEVNWKEKITSVEGWREVSHKYMMEWQMVWKDVTVGFTVAGIIAAFIPTSFFEALFLGAGKDSLTFFEVLMQSIVGPVAAFFTFIGSMGNIPLAAVLFSNGVSFAGVMAFIFSDLVVFPVLRIQAQYYGWKMAFYLLLAFLAILIMASMVMHYGFAAFDSLPSPDSIGKITEREFFKLDYTAALNGCFILCSIVFFVWWLRTKSHSHGGGGIGEQVLFVLSVIAFLWLIGGAFVVPLLI